jgi:outer membrane receptor protein involved in Fe transport
LGSGYLSRYRSNDWQFRDSMNWMRGRHNFKFGAQFMHLPWVLRFIGAGDMTFSGARSGDPVADFMLGAYDNFNTNFGVVDNDSIQNSPSFFFQDEFKASPRLTLTFGVR